MTLVALVEQRNRKIEYVLVEVPGTPLTLRLVLLDFLPCSLAVQYRAKIMRPFKSDRAPVELVVGIAILTGIFSQQAEYGNRSVACLLHERVKPLEEDGSRLRIEDSNSSGLRRVPYELAPMVR